MNAEKVFYKKISSSLCDIVLIGNEKGLMRLHLDTHAGKRGNLRIEPTWTQSPTMFGDAKKQLSEYFAGSRTKFTVKLNLQGTDFQKRVWNCLLKIPFGQTRSYKEIAKLSGSPAAVRAVGGAVGKNPVGIIVPCHRVIGSNGSLTGFAHGLQIKSRLLKLEGLNFPLTDDEC